ncbi:MAG: Na+/H+ antiporter NhaA [Phycisphaerae bacterium]|nr:Na+/H+ antiporter NhaA [Phycisphaerae bacterium]
MARKSHESSLSRRRTPLDAILRPFREFAGFQASGGIMLLAAAAVALVWANSPWKAGYDEFWSDTRLTIGPAGHGLTLTLGIWINDLLMALFFLLVGLEVKREILVGELATVRKATLPVLAALGGMAVPGTIYAALNLGGATLSGWGIPVATDIAFALGVLALFGSRIPTSLKVFLASLAIADDIGALLIIAIFYTEHLHMGALYISAGLVGLLVVLNLLHVMAPGAYLLVGAFLWYFVHESGVHATIAGVLVALTIPGRSRVDVRAFVDHGRRSLETFEDGLRGGPARIMTNSQLVDAVHELQGACEKVETPLQRLEHALHPWVAFVIVPLFALANAGISISVSEIQTMSSPVVFGVILGLVLGKPLGIMVFCGLAVRTGLSSLPSGVTWLHMAGVSCLAGIGFTMSLFITYLAFSDPHHIASAKLGVVAASFLAAAGGALFLVRSPSTDREHEQAPAAH